MPKLNDKKVKIGQLQKLPAEQQAKFIEPIVKANAEQFSRIANTIVEAANFGKTVSNLASSFKLPIVDIIDKLKLPELPQIPDFYSSIDTKSISLQRYDPPVTIRKSKWELEQEEKQAYLTDLHIQLLEAQLAIAKGTQTPQYDINTGIIKFMGREIEIPLNTNI